MTAAGAWAGRVDVDSFDQLGLAVWTSYGHTGTSDNVIVASRVSANNTGESVVVSGLNASARSQVTLMGDGNYLVTYSDGSTSGARVVNAFGTPQGGTIALSLTAFHETVRLEDNRIVIAYSQGADVAFQILNADGTASSEVTTVASDVVGTKGQVDVVALADGGFFMTWHTNVGGATAFDSFGQRFSALGREIGDEVQLNTTTTASHHP